MFLSFFMFGFSKEEAESSETRLKVSGNISLNSNGIAPIPSFSLNKPAVIAAFTLEKRRFSYDPQIAYGLDFKPWIIDNWLHYKLINRPSFIIRTGIDFSMFFSEYESQDYKIWQGQKYIALEMAFIYKISPQSSLSLMYWNDRGQDKGTIKGHFYNFVYDRTDINIAKNLMMAVNWQVFYINYTGKNDGLFIAPKISSSMRNIPVSINFQVTQAMKSNISPFPGFRWNAGVAFLF